MDTEMLTEDGDVMLTEDGEDMLLEELLATKGCADVDARAAAASVEILQGGTVDVVLAAASADAIAEACA